MGEKPNKIFLNLENRNRINESINEIRINEQTIITTQQNILQEVKSFYENLYKIIETDQVAEDRN